MTHPGLNSHQSESYASRHEKEGEEKVECVVKYEDSCGSHEGRCSPDDERRPVVAAQHSRDDRLEQHAEHGGGSTEGDGEGLAKAEEEVLSTISDQDRGGDSGPQKDHQ